MHGNVLNSHKDKISKALKVITAWMTLIFACIIKTSPKYLINFLKYIFSLIQLTKPIIIHTLREKLACITSYHSYIAAT